MVNEVQLIEAKDMRDKVIDNVDVLNKVKKLFLIPEMEVMTTKMVADYYEVGYDTVRVCYQRNKEEIESDGVQMASLKTLKAHFVPTMIEHGKCIFKITNDITLEVPNRGIKVFPKRAILRIGMLLRDSEVAKEVRTQLLNTFEHSTIEQKTAEINEELMLQTNIGIAYASGDMDEVLKATSAYNSYKNRYIEKLEDENVALTKLNDGLSVENKLLARKAMEWGYKPILNSIMRTLALACFHGKFYHAWNALYKQVKYKHGYDFKLRTGAEKIIDRIKEEEFPDVVSVAVAMCEANHIDVTKVINSINAENINNT